MLKAAVDVYAPEQGDQVVRFASALCGGMGNNKATCGVFTGGALALSLFTDGAVGKQRDTRIKPASADFQERLAAEVGGHVCEELLSNMGMLNWNKRMCRLLTRHGAEVLAEVIDQYHLSPDKNPSK
ncbi:MAG: 1-deoxy-D-xylulose-5-phosphate synthase [Sedimenticola sp.]|nr:MAG: 1-deoxy-D-xylulose-5-phosphate synthase [Sedimenticola sp.]